MTLPSITENPFEQMKENRRLDAERFKQLDKDVCMVCGAKGFDKRNLMIRCFYQLKEIIPEMIDLTEVTGPLKGSGYYLRICKDCRARFLGKLRLWWQECVGKRGLPMDEDGCLEPTDPERNIPVRVDGGIQ